MPKKLNQLHFKTPDEIAFRQEQDKLFEEKIQAMECKNNCAANVSDENVDEVHPIQNVFFKSNPSGFLVRFKIVPKENKDEEKGEEKVKRKKRRKKRRKKKKWSKINKME